MGIGLVVVCPEAQADRIVRVFKSYRQDAMRIGNVERKSGVRVEGRQLN